jgi:hypothetical protein
MSAPGSSEGLCMDTKGRVILFLSERGWLFTLVQPVLLTKDGFDVSKGPPPGFGSCPAAFNDRFSGC